jgi:Lipocalin-like domain
MPSVGIVILYNIDLRSLSRVPPASVSGARALLVPSVLILLTIQRKNTMNRRSVIGISAAAALGLALLGGNAVAQSAKDLVGTWTPVSVEIFGPNPKGNLTFDANGRFSLQLLRADLKKIAANKRDMGTTEENQAIVHGSIAYYGTYTMNGTELVFHVEASSFPNWSGTDQKRTNVILTADQLTYTNPAPSVGPGTSNVLVWKRAPAVRTN